MANNYDNYDDEATRLDSSLVPREEKNVPAEQIMEQTADNRTLSEILADEKINRKTGNRWGKVAAGVGGAVALGAAGFGLSSFVRAPHDGEGDNGHHNPLVDDDVDIADDVNDGMSFREAFSAARAEVGPGGVFEWRGGIYSTYTAEEWNAMSPAEREEFNSNFAWNRGESGHHDVQPQDTYQADMHQSVHVETAGPPEVVATEEHVAGHEENVHTVGMEGGDGEPEVEVLGVTHDDERNVNVGSMLFNGEEVVLLDVDNDQTFDVMARDDNHDGNITEPEIHDIRGAGITTDNIHNLDNTGHDYSKGGEMPQDMEGVHDIHDADDIAEVHDVEYNDHESSDLDGMPDEVYMGEDDSPVEVDYDAVHQVSADDDVADFDPDGEVNDFDSHDFADSGDMFADDDMIQEDMYHDDPMA